MKRLKTFLIYALLIAALWIFSDVMMHLLIKGGEQNSNNIDNVNSQQVSLI